LIFSFFSAAAAFLVTFSAVGKSDKRTVPLEAEFAIKASFIILTLAVLFYIIARSDFYVTN
jgi:hypothetical protein